MIEIYINSGEQTRIAMTFDFEIERLGDKIRYRILDWKKSKVILQNDIHLTYYILDKLELKDDNIMFNHKVILIIESLIRTTPRLAELRYEVLKDNIKTFEMVSHSKKNTNEIVTFDYELLSHEDFKKICLRFEIAKDLFDKNKDNANFHSLIKNAVCEKIKQQDRFLDKVVITNFES